MSCGKHHDVDCEEILARLVFFVDQELEHADLHDIQRHLDECAPCLADYDLERTVKALVARACLDQAPDHLRRRVQVRIREVHVQVTESRLEG